MNIQKLNMFPGMIDRPVDVDAPWEVVDADRNRSTIKFAGVGMNEGLTIELQYPDDETYMSRFNEYIGSLMPLLHLLDDPDQVVTNKELLSGPSFTPMVNFSPEFFDIDLESDDPESVSEE